jgi:RNA polymerase sigma-70 factor (ECF subfamily)
VSFTCFFGNFLWKSLEYDGTLRKANIDASDFLPRAKGLLMQQQAYLDYTMSDLPDAVLTHEACAGEQQAFEMLVKRYQTPLFNFIYRFVGDYDQAWDISQEVFLRLYLSLSSLEVDKPLKPWLFQVARNRCIDEIRRRQRHALDFSYLTQGDYLSNESRLDQIIDPDPLPAEVFEQHDLQCLLQQAIASLPTKLRAIVMLRYTTQLSFPQIACILDMQAATVKTYFARAKVRLRQALENVQI